MKKNVNWSQAFAEVVLLGVGVALALLADSWYQAQENRTEEAAYLQALRTDFEETIANLTRNLEFNARIRDGNLEFLELLASPRDSVSPQRLQELSADAFYINLFQPVLGTYRDMVNSGKLELLRSDSLRIALASFETDLEIAQAVVQEGFQQYNDIQVPFLIENLDVRAHNGGEHRGIRFPDPRREPRIDAYWSIEFENILATAIVSKGDIIAEGENLIRAAEMVLRLIDDSVDAR